jgi:hypothetical protein
LEGSASITASPPAASCSKRLGNLAQPRRTIRIESENPRRPLDHPIGRNEHGDGVGRTVIFRKPWQRAVWSAAQMQDDPLLAQLASTLAAVSSASRIMTALRDAALR